MARGGWRRHMSKAHQKTSRSTLGNLLPVAVLNVEELADRVAAATVRLEFSREQLIHWLFKPDAVQKLCAVKGFVNPSSWRYRYGLTPGPGNLSLDFQTSSIVTPMNSAWEPQPEAYPFIETVDKLRAIYQDFMKVMHVMNWMDANATPGAIRQYWPTMLSLAPDCMALKEASTFRYTEPAGISPMLPLIRDTATIVAGALLLPQYEPSPSSDPMLVTFGSYPYEYDGIEIATPYHVFRLVNAQAP